MRLSYMFPACPSTRPLWLSPRQVMLVPVNPSCEEYAKRVGLLHPYVDHVSAQSVELQNADKQCFCPSGL